MISVFDIFKIGIGPSSSHTVGPMKAGKQFIDDLIQQNILTSTTRISVDVYGSLSLTGKGHATDTAIIMGLAGNLPDTVDIDAIPAFIRHVEESGKLLLANGQHEVEFPTQGGMNFHSTNLPLHENGMTITAFNADNVIYKKRIIPLVVDLLLMRNILVNQMINLFKFLIPINMLLIYKSIVKKQACRFLP
ncbi:L-serine dehydratase 1 [Providencia sneebia DSM 19967]|uniref:L-serine ammonia-lyase n=1 Tax=Providencia sneebia DSM 19967 TaxID=1141660 RepID=K8WCP0_9GAMM|nr:L-serine dehydratase 1 [Providencia sneebia DSM 19967]